MNAKQKNRLKFWLSLIATIVLIYTTFIKESTPVFGFLLVMLCGTEALASFCKIIDNDEENSFSAIGSLMSGLTDITALGEKQNTTYTNNNRNDNYGDLSFTERHKIREAVKEIEKAKKDYRIK